MFRTSVEEIPGFETLLCPVCGFYYVHPLKVKVATGEFTVIVDAKGFRVLDASKSEDSKVAVWNRGVRICLEYWCEYGHHGEDGCDDARWCLNLKCPCNRAELKHFKKYGVRNFEDLKRLHGFLEDCVQKLKLELQGSVVVAYEKPPLKIRRVR